MVHRPEEPAPAVPPGVDLRRIRAPQLVGPIGHDPPGVGAIAMHVVPPRGRQEVRLPHQAQHARLPDGDPARP